MLFREAVNHFGQEVYDECPANQDVGVRSGFPGGGLGTASGGGSGLAEEGACGDRKGEPGYCATSGESGAGGPVGTAADAVDAERGFAGQGASADVSAWQQFQSAVADLYTAGSGTLGADVQVASRRREGSDGKPADAERRAGQPAQLRESRRVGIAAVTRNGDRALAIQKQW